ncbi:MAG: hypothetical protein VB064_02530 [Oscillospiraceae bacterium]|nr:hypothetical protein [Oscillospiraceae bacterium]
MKDKSSLVDMAKNLAIILLSLSAVFLLFKATVIGNGSFLDGIYGLFGDSSASDTVELPENEVAELASDPVYLLVTAANGSSHYAVKYGSDDKEKLIAQFSTDLGDALGSSGNPEEVSVEQWRTALLASGVFFDYLYPQPLCAIASSLGTEINGGASLDTARRFLLSSDGEELVLYYLSESNGKIYRCNTALSFSSLEPKIAECPIGSASFAFELGKDFSALDPYFIFSHEKKALRAVNVSNPVRDGYDGAVLLECFGLNSRVVSEYTESDGSVAYVEGGKSLRIESSGKVIFDTSEDSGILIGSSSGELTITDCISACSKIVKNSIGQISGEGVTELVNVSNLSSPSSCIISFGYYVDGIPVTLPNGKNAASFQILDGKIVKAELYLRSYTFPGETIVPLPEEQAAAIAKSTGGEPLLTYEDKGDSVAFTWIRLKPMGV